MPSIDLPTIEGHRVTLEPYAQETHYDAMCKAFDDDPRAFEDMIRDSFKEYAPIIAKADGAYAVRCQGDKYAGVFWLDDYSPTHRKLDFSVVMNSHFWGTRCLAEAHYLLFKYLREGLKLNRLQFTIRTENEYSRINVERIGAFYEGTLRRNYVDTDGYAHDELCYSIVLNSEWDNLFHLANKYYLTSS